MPKPTKADISKATKIMTDIAEKVVLPVTRGTKSTPAARKAKRDKATESNKNAIVLNKATADGAYVLIQAGDGRHFLREKKGDNKAFRAVAQIGLSYDAAEKWHKTNPVPKPQAKLAQGVDSHNSPHSAKAVADQKSSAKQPAKGKGGKDRTVKADKTKQPAKGGNRAYTLAGRKDESRPDTFRRYMLSTIMSCKDTDSAKAKHAKSNKYPTHKLDFNWAAQQGYIKFTK